MKKFLAVIAVLAFAGAAHADDAIDYAKQIRPIFAESCYKCHNAKKQKGKLRLDSVAAIEKGGKDGKILTPGDAAKSDLFRRITLTKDDDEVMPPEGDLLPKDKQALIKQWINSGASFGNWKAETADAAAGQAAPSDAMPAEPQLPKVSAADNGAIDKIRQTGALAMPLAQDTNLVEVDMNLVGDKIQDSQLALIQPVDQQLAVLNLSRTGVTDEGLKSVENLPNLRKLHLENTKITDAGLSHLKNLKSLEYLNLYNTAVTDAGMTDLQGLKNLKTLYLWQTKVTPAGVEQLKAALPKCEINTGWEKPAEAAKANTEKAAAK